MYFFLGFFTKKRDHNSLYGDGNQRFLGGPGLQRQFAPEQGHFQHARPWIPPAQFFFPPQPRVPHFQSFGHGSAEYLWSPPTFIGVGEEPATPARWHAPTNLQAFELFETMLMCGPGTGWKKYLAIYWLHFENDGSEKNYGGEIYYGGEKNDVGEKIHGCEISLRSPMFENDKDLHAERVLTHHLKTLLSVAHMERLKAITIMQNASPCSRCAAGYRDDLRTLLSSGIKISVVFSSFHWIERASCTCRDPNHPHRRVLYENHTANARGLRELSNAGVTVRTTCYEDWEKLCSELRIPFPLHLQSRNNYRNSRRGREDINIKKDLEVIFRASHL